MSQPGQQTIVIHILTNISRSKGNQTMKLENIEYNKRYIFFKNYSGNEPGETSSRPLFIY